MKRITFWLDFVSPFAYLAFERLPQALEGASVVVDYRPVLFAGMLQHWGQKGPAEIEPKRAWTFRHVHWLAHRHGIAIDTPRTHPFNPLALLRLALACGPNRHVCETIFRHVWVGGGEANDAERLAALTATLDPARDANGADVKLELRRATDAAVQRGVFGVPTFELHGAHTAGPMPRPAAGGRASGPAEPDPLDGRLFWGFDALPMLAEAVRGDAWFEGPAWQREGAPRAGVQRG